MFNSSRDFIVSLFSGDEIPGRNFNNYVNNSSKRFALNFAFPVGTEFFFFFFSSTTG